MGLEFQYRFRVRTARDLRPNQGQRPLEFRHTWIRQVEAARVGELAAVRRPMGRHPEGCLDGTCPPRFHELVSIDGRRIYGTISLQFV